MSIINIINPKYFILENVRNLFFHNSGKNYKQIKLHLEFMGYKIQETFLDAKFQYLG